MLIEALPYGDKLIRSRPALEAAEAVFADFGWHPADDVVAAMIAASDIKAITCQNLLRELVKAGVLERRGRRPDQFFRWIR